MNLALVDEVILVWALRYAIGRRTYAVSDVACAITDNLEALSPRMRRDLADEIRRRGDDLGDPTIDAPEWLRLLARLEQE